MMSLLVSTSALVPFQSVLPSAAVIYVTISRLMAPPADQVSLLSEFLISKHLPRLCRDWGHEDFLWTRLYRVSSILRLNN
jgi:hypothetical protein